MGNLNDFCLIKRDLASKYDSAISLDHAALIAYCKGKYKDISETIKQIKRLHFTDKWIDMFDMIKLTNYLELIRIACRFMNI